MRFALMIVLMAAVAAGCTGQAGAGAQRGAVTGGLSGAVGGFVGSLVFGGDALENAVGGAVVGMATGATAGAIVGAGQDDSAANQPPRQPQPQQLSDLDELLKRIGEDNFSGAIALVECRHDDALEKAALASTSSDRDAVLASYWLQTVTLTDDRQEARARSLYSTLIERDPAVSDTQQAEVKVRTLMQRLTTVRTDNGLPAVCPA